MAGPGVTRAVAGQRAELVIEVGGCARGRCRCGLGRTRTRAACRGHRLAHSLHTLPTAAAAAAGPQARDDGGCKRLSGGDEFLVALQGPEAGARRRPAWTRVLLSLRLICCARSALLCLPISAQRPT